MRPSGVSVLMTCTPWQGRDDDVDSAAGEVQLGAVRQRTGPTSAPTRNPAWTGSRGVTTPPAEAPARGSSSRGPGTPHRRPRRGGLSSYPLGRLTHLYWPPPATASAAPGPTRPRLSCTLRAERGRQRVFADLLLARGGDGARGFLRPRAVHPPPRPGWLRAEHLIEAIPRSWTRHGFVASSRSLTPRQRVEGRDENFLADLDAPESR